ncbi:MAG: PLP-dependent aspartate aminotransferase family protein [Clostridia bacterium]|nr:PLP-dependent aspartate aminotransferase family protein [Clostridia bacterium]
MGKSSLNIETRLVHGDKGFDPYTGAISYPIYQSATFRHPGLNQTTGYDYSRLQNPTREELENTLAVLENGKAGFAFSSGMAAISALLEIFSPGDHIIVSDDLYGGTYRLFEEICKKHGLEFSYIDTSVKENLKNAVKANSRGIFIETPSNPMMKVTDIQFAVEIAKSHKMITIVDNTFLTPYFQKPMDMGADYVIHSGTKYLGGHNDTLAGFIVVKDDENAERIKLVQKSVGAVLAPFDSWLILRGIKTLAVRLNKQQKNACEIAKWLNLNKSVERVHYVGLTDHEGYEISKKQSSGFGAMISFTVKDYETISRVLEKVRVISYAESLGGVESLITYPILQTHSAIPKELRERLGVDEKLLRLSVGIEDTGDLINDLEQALA